MDCIAPCWSCVLQEQQRHRSGQPTTPSPPLRTGGGGGGCRKAVQTLTFDAALAHSRSRHDRGTPAAGPAPVDGPRLSEAARGSGGAHCSFHHRGPHCFPSRHRRTAPSQGFRGAAPRATGVVCESGPGPVSCSFPDCSSEPCGSDFWLLWTFVPAHLIAPLVRTPTDAELMLARLKEEQCQLTGNVSA